MKNILFTSIMLFLLSGMAVSQTLEFNATKFTMYNKVTKKDTSFNVDFVITITDGCVEFQETDQKWTYTGPVVHVSKTSFYGPARDNNGTLCKLWFDALTSKTGLFGIEYKNYGFIWKVHLLVIIRKTSIKRQGF